MWQQFEARIEENEKDHPLPLRRALFDVIRGSELRPGGGITKKMLAFDFGPEERLLWEIDPSARNFFLRSRWRSPLEGAGFVCESRPFNKRVKDGGRHSALSREWAFGDEDCIVLRIEVTQDLRRVLDLLLQPSGALTLDPAAVARWIARLREFFPRLERFDKPDPVFDTEERSYKLEVAAKLRAALEEAASDQEIAEAVLAALTESNLLPWRAYWPMAPKGDADRERLWPELAALARAALGPSASYPVALETFVDAWLKCVPKASSDSARQIAEFLFLHLAPNEGIYIRYSVRQDLWLEAVGTRFPSHSSIAETYRDELRFMQAVRRVFEDNGLAPRDMIDVQSALWVVHNYKDEDKGAPELPSLTREAIEAGMDAYDEFRRSGRYAENFASFGDPRDYWVRSTRVREDRIYPTKPIVGFVRGKTELSGGWGQKTDAAVLLHNSGFIIVNRDGTPVAPSDRYWHLIHDADRIRLCALNYYIETAREKGAREVSISADGLARDMGMLNAHPAVCNALGGDKLQQLARVPAPTHTEPNPSSATIFTYQLIEPEGQAEMTSEASIETTSAINLILYGPPGTGKTYTTVWEAVRLCIGETEANSMRHDRDTLTAEYRRLVNDGRIEFVTFHQSFS